MDNLGEDVKKLLEDDDPSISVVESIPTAPDEDENLEVNATSETVN